MKNCYALCSFIITLMAEGTLTDNDCYSCFTHCKTSSNGKYDPHSCDCASETRCQAKACFVKIEVFTEERMAIVQKGCITEVPGNMVGCYYGGQLESINCYCTGSLCNGRHMLDNYYPKKQPLVECCECSETHGDHCPEHKCLRQCKGNYCIIDFDGVEQSCGLGYPPLQDFLRTRNYTAWQGQTICARYQASQATTVHSCSCTNPTGPCNESNRTRSYKSLNVIERRPGEKNYCYSLHYRSKSAPTEDAFRSSDTCEGQYCFISLSTTELFVESVDFKGSYEEHKDFVGVNRTNYEILAGCLNVDDDYFPPNSMTTSRGPFIFNDGVQTLLGRQTGNGNIRALSQFCHF